MFTILWENEIWFSVGLSCCCFFLKVFFFEKVLNIRGMNEKLFGRKGNPEIILYYKIPFRLVEKNMNGQPLLVNTYYFGHITCVNMFVSSGTHTNLSTVSTLKL